MNTFIQKNTLPPGVLVLRYTQIEGSVHMKPLFYQIDPHSGLPVYRQLMDQTKHYIASGTLTKGDQLPSIRDLATRLAVNPATVVKAYSELQNAGVIEMKQGKGAFVSMGVSKNQIPGRKAQVGRIARQLVVESQQLGMELESVQDLVEEEWIALGQQQNHLDDAVKSSVRN